MTVVALPARSIELGVLFLFVFLVLEGGGSRVLLASLLFYQLFFSFFSFPFSL